MDVKDVFWHTSGQKRKKINSLSMKRKLMPILLLIIWPGFNPSDFQKTSKDPNCFIKENQCKNNRHFGRHTSNGSRTERKFANKGDIFLFKTLGFVLNFKKVAGNKVKERKFLGLVINSVT